MDAERKAEIRTRCDPSQRQPCRAYLEDVPDLLAAIDKLTARNAKLEAVAESGKAEHLAATAFLYAYEITIDKLVATDAGDHLNACRVHFARDSAALDALDG